MQFTRRGYYTITGPDGQLLQDDDSDRRATSRDKCYQYITEDGRSGIFTLHCPNREVEIADNQEAEDMGIMIGPGIVGYTATHYVAPYASVDGATSDYDTTNGTAFASATSIGNPCTLGEAMAEATTGDVVECAAGVYIGEATTSRWDCSFAPTYSGLSGNPIIFYAKYPGAYNRGTPANLSEIRRTLNGDGAALSNRNISGIQSYIIFDGFYADESVTLAGAVRGVFSISGDASDGANCEFRRCYIDRTGVTEGDGQDYVSGHNGNAIWVGSSLDCKILDCYFGGDDTLTDYQNSCIEIYNSERLEMANLEGIGGGFGIHIKTDAGTDPGIMDDIEVHHCWFDSVAGGVNIQSTRGAFVHHNLIKSTTEGIRWWSTSPSSKTWVDGADVEARIYNNTVLVNSTDSSPLLMSPEILINSASYIRDNIFRQVGSGKTLWLPYYASAWTQGDPGDLDEFDYNFWVDGSPIWRVDGTERTGFSGSPSYQNDMAGYFQEANSQHGTVTFANEGGDDYTLADNEQDALTASSIGGLVGCYVTGSEEIGLRASPSY